MKRFIIFILFCFMIFPLLSMQEQAWQSLQELVDRGCKKTYDCSKAHAIISNALEYLNNIKEKKETLLAAIKNYRRAVICERAKTEYDAYIKAAVTCQKRWALLQDSLEKDEKGHKRQTKKSVVDQVNSDEKKEYVQSYLAHVAAFNRYEDKLKQLYRNTIIYLEQRIYARIHELEGIRSEKN